MIRLYKAWRNLKDRVRGTNYSGSGTRAWKGLAVGWPNFAAFRAWALANGYSKKHCSLDRIDDTRGYGPDNCRFVTPGQNTAWKNTCAARKRKTAAPSGDDA
jgi:hypothetical protein